MWLKSREREKDLSLSWLLLRNKCLLYVLPLVLWPLRSLYPSPVTFVYLANKQQIAVTAVVSHKQNCFFWKKTGLLISKVPCFKVKSPVLTFQKTCPFRQRQLSIIRLPLQSGQFPLCSGRKLQGFFHERVRFTTTSWYTNIWKPWKVKAICSIFMCMI